MSKCCERAFSVIQQSDFETVRLCVSVLNWCNATVRESFLFWACVRTLNCSPSPSFYILKVALVGQQPWCQLLINGAMVVVVVMVSSQVLAKKSIRQLQLIQNAAARVLNNTKRIEHITPVL